MSGIWPFFNNTFSNATINKILAEIESDQQHQNNRQQHHQLHLQPKPSIQQQQQQQQQLQPQQPKQLSSSPSFNSILSKPKSNGTTVTTTATTTTKTNTLNNHNTSNNSSNNNNSTNIPASATQLLQSIQENDTLSTTNLTSAPTITTHQIFAVGSNKNSLDSSPSTNINKNTTPETTTTTTTGKSTTTEVLNDQFQQSSSSSLPNSSTVNIHPSTLDNSSSINTSSSPVFNQINNYNDNSSKLLITSLNINLFNKLIDQQNLIDELNMNKNNKLNSYLTKTEVLEIIIEYILISLDVSIEKNHNNLNLNHPIFQDCDENSNNTNNNNSNDNDNFQEIIKDDSTFNTINNDSDFNNTGNFSTHSDFSTNSNINSKSIEEKLLISLKRSITCFEILLVCNNNIIIPMILSGFEFPLIKKLWRGFFNKPIETYTTPTILKISSASSNNNNNNNIIGTLDDENEDENENELYSEPHNLSMLNKFLKFIDSIASFNMNSLMNFIRFEQNLNNETLNITNQFLNLLIHLSQVGDLLVRLISTDKHYNPNGLIEILMDQNLIVESLRLIKLHYLDHRIQDNLCVLLNSIVGISSNVGFWEDMNNVNGLNEFGEPITDGNGNDQRASNPNIGPNDLTRQLVNKTCVYEMLDILLNYGHYGLVTIVSVIIEVIRKNNSDYDDFDWVNSVKGYKLPKKFQSDVNTNLNENQQDQTTTPTEGDEVNSIPNDNNNTNPDVSVLTEFDNDDSNIVDEDMTINDSQFDLANNRPNSRDPIYLGTLLKLFSLHLQDLVESYLSDKYYLIRDVDMYYNYESSKPSTSESEELDNNEATAATSSSSATGILNDEDTEDSDDTLVNNNQNLLLNENIKDRIKNQKLKLRRSNGFKNGKIPKLNSSIGEVIEPLGYERFKIMELIAELLHCSNMMLMNKSSKLDYLLHKRDLLRDVKQTEKLVLDALNDNIVDYQSNSKSQINNNFENSSRNISKKSNNNNDENSKNDSNIIYDYSKHGDISKSMERLSVKSDDEDNNITSTNSLKMSSINSNNSKLDSANTVNDTQDEQNQLLSQNLETTESQFSQPTSNLSNSDAESESESDDFRDTFIKLPLDLSIGNFLKLQLLESNAIPLIIIKLIKFSWNNFMHNVIFDLVQQIFNGRLVNWDEDQSNQEFELSIYDSNLNLNKILIWSLFGDFDDFDNIDNFPTDSNYPGFFNLPSFILYAFDKSNEYESKNNFKLGYMGHLTLVAEEIHKFQNYVENFGLTREDQTLDVLEEQDDSINPYYLKSSLFIYTTLYKELYGDFENNRFRNWNYFLDNQLKEINIMYNKVLGAPNELEEMNDNSTLDLDRSNGVILLDNGDNENFRTDNGIENIEDVDASDFDNDIHVDSSDIHSIVMDEDDDNLQVINGQEVDDLDDNINDDATSFDMRREKNSSLDEFNESDELADSQFLDVNNQQQQQQHEQQPQPLDDDVYDDYDNDERGRQSQNI
ncbi:hypothetical protein BVG19_g3135 [[Candida] boidinii]|nr:hypothetical protein BVG19_g3135 [[Candida] boidinii]OWB50929.1 hypothetical protein B5S27_g2483 [[Candida] boidinii]